MAPICGLITVVAITAMLPWSASAQPMPHSKCRFSQLYSWSDLVRDHAKFEIDIFYWEGQFHQNGIGYNANNGMTFDGCGLDPASGLASPQRRHRFSAASKEALQIMVYTHALLGHDLASGFVYPWNPKVAPQFAAAVLNKKLNTYRLFNSTYPGYGGFLPWFLADQVAIRPTEDWVNRVPALDNGELLWAVYGLVCALHQSSKPEIRQLGDSWQHWLDEVSRHAARVFYRGNGRICAISSLRQDLTPSHPTQNYSCADESVINDPYEGELFAWWLLFFGGLSQKDKDSIWEAKRPQLLAINYTGSIVNTSASNHGSVNYSSNSVQPPSIVPITIQQGYWFSSHEQWKLLEMPYLDVDIVRRVFKNAERVRTCNSRIMGNNPGLFASVNDVTDPITGQIQGYISNAGVPSVAKDRQQRLDIITPYSVFPTLLFDRTIGLIWYKNMLDARGMQNPYGSSESLRRDGTGISAFVSWDSKITTVVALLGGVGNIVKEKMVKDSIYYDFVKVLDREYGLVFGDQSGRPLLGEDVQLCLPDVRVPVRNVTDFTMCA